MNETGFRSYHVANLNCKVVTFLNLLDQDVIDNFLHKFEVAKRRRTSLMPLDVWQQLNGTKTISLANIHF